MRLPTSKTAKRAVHPKNKNHPRSGQPRAHTRRAVSGPVDGQQDQAGGISIASNRHALWFTARGYALRSTLRRLVQRKLASVTTLGVMSLSLTLPVLLFLLLPDMLRVTADSTSSPGLVAYLDTSLSDIEGARLATSIEQRADVQSTDYVSKADALAQLRQSGDADNVNKTIELLGNNPLPGTVLIKPAGDVGRSGSEEHQRLAEVMRNTSGVSAVEVDIEWVERLAAIRSFVQTAGWLCLSVLVIASIMVLSNTVRLEALRYTQESSVIHLLGGKRGFRQRPFVYLGGLLGGLAGLIACLLACIAMTILNVPLQALAHSYALSFALPLPGLSTLLKIVIVSTLLGTITALFTVRQSTLSVAD